MTRIQADLFDLRHLCDLRLRTMSPERPWPPNIAQASGRLRISAKAAIRAESAAFFPGPPFFVSEEARLFSFFISLRDASALLIAARRLAISSEDKPPERSS
jgi:hypothetical protein